MRREGVEGDTVKPKSWIVVFIFFFLFSAPFIHRQFKEKNEEGGITKGQCACSLLERKQHLSSRQKTWLMWETKHEGLTTSK